MLGFEPQQKKYYTQFTEGLAPDHHEKLDPLARALRHRAYDDAKGRDEFIRAHPHAYHSRADHNKHLMHVDKAYGEWEFAEHRQVRHEKYRSSEDDPRRDKWDRPVAYRQHR